MEEKIKALVQDRRREEVRWSRGAERTAPRSLRSYHVVTFVLVHTHCEQVEELNLDTVRASEFSGLGEGFSGLKRLSAINVGLTSLEGLPPLPSLERVSRAWRDLTVTVGECLYLIE